MKPWSKAKRDRVLARARFFERYVQRLRRQVKEHTPKRAAKEPT